MSFANPVKMPTNNAEAAVYGSDAGLWVVFERRPVFMEHQSKLAGREIWEDRDFVIIQQPGAKTNVERQVRLESAPNFPADTIRFRAQWEAFQSSHEQTQIGVPLEQWAGIGKSRVLEMKAMKIHTVEQLAELPDSIMQTLGMGARELRTAAKSYLDSAFKNAEVAKMQAENDGLKNEMEVMRRQIAELASLQNGVTATPPPVRAMDLEKRGPGRPRKEQTDDV